MDKSGLECSSSNRFQLWEKLDALPMDLAKNLSGFFEVEEAGMKKWVGWGKSEEKG